MVSAKTLGDVGPAPLELNACMMIAYRVYGINSPIISWETPPPSIFIVVKL